jgi:hypothetical protein
VAEQQHTAGATQLAERPAHAGSPAEPAASATTTNTTAKSSNTPRRPGGSSNTPGTGTKPIPFAAVSFVSGLVGLLVANLVLGPLAIVLGAIGLRADKNRRVRAVLGILLGVADIAVLLFLAAHSGAHHGSLSWNFFSR